ncbi:TPA: PfkB family carbohydrate kinase [Citrobacter pasteurii]|uniref:PfkB family carbohydrate kinase n=1 Tax=unclassified Citrobacter TaxID=2644389 RepID=UPI002575E840|nr:PfkB family carbohydrate kinase [Citrobacter sp. Cu233]MDM2933261.1 PfkB family carbohydrate kinase [Citrobacter sp. Cu233]
MKKQERQKAIRVKLVTDKKVYVSELAKELSVTTRTIRNDLNELSQNSLFSLFHGGAQLKSASDESLFEQSFTNTILNGFKSHREEIVSVSTHAKQNSYIDDSIYILGSFNIDIVSETTTFPQIGQTIRASATRFYAGGKGTNQAVAAAKINNNVHLTVKLGADEFSKKAKRYLTNTEISSFSFFENEMSSTGIAMVWVSGATGDNMISIDLGANETFTQEDILLDIDTIRNCKVFLTQLENNFPITRFAIMQAKLGKSLVVLNPAPYVSEIKEILHLIDIITPNRIEAEALSGINIIDIYSAKNAARSIYVQGAKCVIITLGSDGCLIFDGTVFTHIPAYKSAVVDTSGAGDAFTGALAACIANGKGLINAAQYASAFASLKVERKGASNMPNNSLVYHRMQ